MGDEAQPEEYIYSITEKIRFQIDKNPKAWIVDLRDNFGGNMWPMICSVGPLLKEGVQGYFVDGVENYKAWIYSNGKKSLDSTVVQENPNYIELKNKNVKIAVLTNE